MDSTRRKLNIMFVYAHVADSAIEASGTAALHADLGDNVTFVICGYGERHHPDMFLDDEEAPGRTGESHFVRASLADIREIKRQEALRAAEILGVKEVIFLDWDDDYYEMTEARVKELANVLLRVRPDVLITHLPVNHSHPRNPHAVVGQTVQRAMGIAGTRIRQIDGVMAHHVKEVYYFPMGGEIADSRDPLTEGIVCDVWIDITPVIDRKVQATDQIVSQGYQGQTVRKVMEAREARWGMLAGCSYAEPFLRGAGLTYGSLPISESLLNKKFVPNDLPGNLIIAHDVPVARGS